MADSVYNTTIEIGEEEDVPVRVHYTFCRAYKGSTDGRYGPKLEPDEPAHLEDVYAELEDGREIELTKEQQSRIEEEIGQHIAESSQWCD